MKINAIAALFAVTLGLTNLAEASTITRDYDFTQTGLPTWVRPNQNGSNPPNSLFGPGSSNFQPNKIPMAYFTLQFHVDTAGVYQFFSAHPDDDGDLFTLLYQGSFNPTDQFNNVLIANDDAYKNPAGQLWEAIDPSAPWGTGEVYGSGFEYTLAANTDYIFVNTLFSGNYIITGSNKIDTLTITGPGNISVPEPSFISLLAGGLALLAARRRNYQL